MLVYSLKPGIIAANKRGPSNKTKIESACLIPCLDAMNNPTVRGNKNIKIIPSNLNWIENAVNPDKNLRSLNTRNLSVDGSEITPENSKIIKAIVTIPP